MNREARRSLQVSHSRGYPRKLRSGRFRDQDCIMISYSPHIVLTCSNLSGALHFQERKNCSLYSPVYCKNLLRGRVILLVL
ncbi:hypothetical protein M404DRAFT_622720 [Pisolithus tinctorius Marx 270]|uniref:Uncharacterized protein n=1 Tax=Pisolithus tinctorius Marx 270 TaxID=870435 RepID=A0A0C3K1T5_PISTI|nr:hypothetical protein M404DRAFT_622720 [Pisolithus tinctorius Marx 270]